MQSLPELKAGTSVQYWFDDSMPAFAIVANVRDNPNPNQRPDLTLAVLNPISGGWINKIQVQPVIDDGLRFFRAKRWSFYEDNVKPTNV